MQDTMDGDVFGLLGRTIDEKVRVDEPIGEGAFAVVYRGFHLAFEQPVAVKCLKIPKHFDEAAQTAFLAKFQEEGKMLFRLSQHASIVRVFDLGEVQSEKAGRVPYLVLELIHGIDFESFLFRRAAEGVGGLSESEALALLRPAVDAIALAHRLGIAHRDLKPTNLMLAETVQGTVVKVLDFGIAKAMQDGDTMVGSTTRTAGEFQAFSPQYGAPEQFRGRRYGATGPWTDIHAMGLIMVELVAGRPAMLGEEYADFYDHAMNDERPTPRACGVMVSDSFEALCRRCLVRDPAERIQDADELLAAIDALQMGVRGLMESERQEFSAPDPSATNDEAEDEFLVPSLVPPTQTEEPVRTHAETSVDDRLSELWSVPNAQTAGPVSHVKEEADSTVFQPKSRWTLRAAVLGVVTGLLLSAAIFGWWLPTRTAQKAGANLVVPGGAFMMGSFEGAPDQRPPHYVGVASFELDAKEVTVEAFSLCVNAGACKPTESVHLTSSTENQALVWDRFCNWGKTGREQHPMNCLDWNQAKAFCSWAKKRLPTEQEWEYAARGGAENRLFPWGDAKPAPRQFNGCSTECTQMASRHGWKWNPLTNEDDGWPATAPVGAFPSGKGRWGHEDLSGNVWEWTVSPFCAYGTDDPAACSTTHMVARGGGWASRYIGIFRATFRAKFLIEYRSQDVGFRCAR